MLSGALCIKCVLFGRESTHNASTLLNLFRAPLNTWSSALQRLREHEDKPSVHRTGSMRVLHFKSFMQNKTTSVDLLMNTCKREQIATNRQYLRPIVDLTLLCGKQTIPFRGHPDDSRYYEDDSVNPGTFQEILKYGAKYSKNIQLQHMHGIPRNATYCSKTSHNDIITICGELIQEKLVNEVKTAKFFPILADEATDCSNVEQMSLVI